MATSPHCSGLSNPKVLSAWWAGLVAGLWVGQVYGVFDRPGFGSLVPVPSSLSTQPPFAAQAFIINRILGDTKFLFLC